jgi:uncharacterized repeat protein (TIGR01451 family)
MLESNQTDAFLGCSVATAGDVNGDGYSDVIVGAYAYDNGQTNEGRAYVYLGSAAGLASSAAWTAESDQEEANFGFAVATAGDVNGDGYSDVIVGAHVYDNGQWHEGRAYVYLGSASGLGTTAAWMAESDQVNGYFGDSVATAGDVNGDGYSDVIVGAPMYDNGQVDEGRAYVYLGSASGLAGTAAWTAESNQVDAYLGYSVATAGDVNGDGYSDVIVGAPDYDNVENMEGRAYVYLGSASGLGSTPAWTAESNQGGAQFSRSVATAGDVNGDGYSDVIVGAFGYDNGELNEGMAFVYLGSATGLGTTADWTAESNQVDAYLGFSVATAGDVNGDGFSDVIVGASNYSNGQTNEGRAYVFCGGPDGLASVSAWTAAGEATSNNFGFSVATAGDVNGDGYSDVVVGADYYSSYTGKAYLYLGGPSGLSATSSWTATGEAINNRFGISVATAGDVNGDGYSDVIVGAFGYNSFAGKAYLYLGGPSGLSATASWTAAGEATGNYFGRFVATAGDVNGDGYSDVVVSAWAYSSYTGKAYLYLGGPSGLSATSSWSAVGEAADNDFGMSVATAGDVNGDGYSDVVVGASGYNSFTGKAYLYMGGPSGLSAASSWTAVGAAAYDFLGVSVATAGDVNGDGYSDVVVSAQCNNSTGKVYLYLGGPSGLSATSSWTATGEAINNYFGLPVGTAGDVNGDGYSDVVVGAFGYNSDAGKAYLYLGGPSGLSATSSWSAVGEAADNDFGMSVATAGDVNGDGYSDVVVGAYGYSSTTGKAYLYLGGGGPGVTLRPQQRRSDDVAPVAALGMTDSPTGFRVAALGRSPFGRGQVKLQWEVKPLGTLFDGTGAQTSGSWMDSGTAGAALSELVTGLSQGGVYHWRTRLLYHPVTTPYQQAGRWLTVPRDGWQEADLKTRSHAEVSLTQTDSPDPLLLGGGNITYALAIGNAGPDPTTVTLTDTLPAGTTFVSATPSVGTCNESGGVVTCNLGSMSGGGSATVDAVVTPPSAGIYTNSAALSSTAARENDRSNNADSETTTVNAPAIGNFVWEDTDGDGIQDAGEAGMAGIVVQLYDSTYTWLGQKVTNPSGYYQFTGLTYGQGYFIKVFVPSTDYSFSQPNQGSDDTLDSDVDITTGQTPIFNLVNGLDPARWDAGLVYQIACVPPDEACWIYLETKSVPDNYPIIHWQDWNQLNQRTGWNVRRSNDPAPPKDTWPVVASNILDGDAGTPNNQWTDISEDDPGPPYYTWYYQVTAYNSYCPAEGPF